MNVKIFNVIKPFLFDNKSIRQTIFKNTFWLAAASGISKLLKFILFVYVARILGATEYGKFTFALAFAGLFIILSDLGLSQIITREFSREKEKEKEFSAIISFKILLSLGTFILVLLGSFLITPDPVVQKIIWILALCLLSGSFSQIIFAFFHARQKMEYHAFTVIFEALMVTGIGLFILFYHPSVENLSYSYLFASLIALIFVLIFFHFKIQPLFLNWDKTIWQKFFKMSWPLALVAALASIHNQIDSVMMGSFNQITQTGWYNAAYRIIAVTLVPVGLVSASFFPVLSRSFKETKEKLQKVWNYYMEIIIFFAIPILIGGIVLAPGIINFVYDSSYVPSILAFQILIIMAAIIFIYTPFYALLIASDQQKKFSWAVLFGAIVNIILNLILIPKYSLYGAAFATVVTHSLIFFLLFKFILKFTSVNPVNKRLLLSFVLAILSGILMYFVIIQSQTYQFNILLSILIGAATYSISYLILRRIAQQLIFYEEK